MSTASASERPLTRPTLISFYASFAIVSRGRLRKRFPIESLIPRSQFNELDRLAVELTPQHPSASRDLPENQRNQL